MFRPVRARRVIYSCIVVIVLLVIVGNVWLPMSGAGAWGIGSRVALGSLVLSICAFLHRLASVRIIADDAGATVVNIVQRRRLEWAQIVGARLSADDPWLLLDLSDGESLAAMGVQRSEGRRAQQQAREFARMVDEHSASP